MIGVTIQGSEQIAALARRLYEVRVTIGGAPGMRAVWASGARAAANVFRTHFRKRNLEGNKKGWQPSGTFWREVRDSVSSDATDRGGSVTVADPRYAQKVFGGEIAPKRGTYLAIPMHPAAYKRSPRTFGDGLSVEFRKVRGQTVLFLADAATDEFMYVLKRSVFQDADPAALPDEGEIGRAAARAMESSLTRLVARALA